MTLIETLSRRIQLHDLARRDDAELLRAVASDRSPDAVHALVERHGPLVWHVCRRELGAGADAEDAFQATFLVLLRRAGSIRRGESLAAWLHGVARKVAARCRASRRRRESLDFRLPQRAAGRDPLDDLTVAELMRALDEEVARLPLVYRAPLLMCFWQGLTQAQAARQLGCTAGSIKARIERGRRRLADRLARRGFAAPLLLAIPVTLAALPRELLARTVALAQPSAIVPGAVAALVAGVPAWRMAVVALAAMAALAWGFASRLPTMPADQPAREAAARTNLPDGAVRRLGSHLFNHGEQIQSLAVSPDGRTVVTGGWSNIRAWDAATGEPVGQFDDHTGNIFSLSFTADGRRMLSAGGATDTLGLAYLWDVPSRKLIRRQGFDQWVRSAAITPNGRHIVVAGDRGMIRLLDGETFETKREWSIPDNTYANVMAISRDGRLVATKGIGNSVCVRRLDDGEIIRAIGNVPNVNAMCFSPDATTLALAQMKSNDKDSVVQTWSVGTGKELSSFAVKSMVFTLAFSPKGDQLTAGSRGPITIWNLEAKKVEREITEDLGWIHGVAHSPDGEWLYGACTGMRVRVWNPRTWNERFPVNLHKGGIIGISLSPDRTRLATASGDKTIRLWNLADGTTTAVLTGHAKGLLGVAWSGDGKHVISTSGDGSVRLWDAAGGRESRVLFAPDKNWNARLAVSSDGTKFAIGEIGRVRIWDFLALKELSVIEGHEGYVIGLSFSPDGRMLATASHSYGDDRGKHEDWSMRVWSVATGRQLAHVKLLYPGNPEFTPDGRGVACLGDENANNFRIFDIADGSPRDGAAWGRVQRFAYSPGRAWMATAHGDGAITVRDGVSGREIQRFAGVPGAVYDMRWRPDGRRLFTAHGDTTAIEWDLTPKPDAAAPGFDTNWNDLRSSDAAVAWRASWRLARAGDDTVAKLRGALKPAEPSANAKRVAAWIADLDHPQFATREAASARLKALGSEAEAALFAAADVATSAEARRRLGTLISALKRRDLSADEIRKLRAIEVLGWIETAASRDFLKVLAAGAPESALTRWADGATRRRP